MSLDASDEVFDTIEPSYIEKYGERPLPFAPQVRALERVTATPQQFYKVARDLRHLECILSQIEIIDGYLLFAGEVAGELYIQVGVVGEENYLKSKQEKSLKSRGRKIVYGRRWLIEDSAPTSEIIQTSLLAVQKAREHELREKISLEFDDKGRRATPFNSHQDAPLMASLEPSMTAPIQDTIAQLIARVRLAGRLFEIVKLGPVDAKRRLLRLRLVSLSRAAELHQELNNPFIELDDQDVMFLIDFENSNSLLHRLAEALISMSNRFVAEHFSFSGFSRFSHRLNPLSVAKFSFDTRNPISTHKAFATEFTRMSYDVDSGKAPVFNSGALGKHQRRCINKLEVAQGFLPKTKHTQTK